jgi:hypothetical protein
MELINAERNRGEMGMVQGDLDEGVLEAGQSSGLVGSIVSVAELFDLLKKEYESAARVFRGV